MKTIEERVWTLEQALMCIIATAPAAEISPLRPETIQPQLNITLITRSLTLKVFANNARDFAPLDIL